MCCLNKETIKHSCVLCQVIKRWPISERLCFIPFMFLCAVVCAVTRGRRWSRLPWGSTPTPWTQTWLGWTCWTAIWMKRDACTATDSSAQSGASQALCERSVVSAHTHTHTHTHTPRCIEIYGHKWLHPLVKVPHYAHYPLQTFIFGVYLKMLACFNVYKTHRFSHAVCCCSTSIHPLMLSFGSSLLWLASSHRPEQASTLLILK